MTRAIAVLFGVLTAVALARDWCPSPGPAPALAAAEPPAEAVTFKMFVGKVGDRVKVTREDKATSTSLLAFQGKKIERVEKSEGTVVHVTEVLEVDARSGAPVKLKRTFEKAERTVGGKATNLPLDGKTVLVEKKGDTFTFTHEGGGAVTGPSRSEFGGEFSRTPAANGFELFFPGDPQKAGASWDVKAAFLKAYERPFLFDHGKTAASAKLVKSYAADGKRFATLEVRAESPLAGIEGFPKDAIRAGSALKFEWKTDGCVDGSVPDRTTVHTLRGRTLLDVDAEGREETISTRKVELLPRK